MPFKQLDVEQWKKAFRRTAIIGLPNSWKTTSIFRDPEGKPDGAWPRPIHLMVYPGEQGSATVKPEEGLSAYVWETNVVEKQSPAQILKEVKNETVAILAGKYGPVTVFAGDGLHKLYGLIYDVKFKELTDTYSQADEDKLRGRAFGLAHGEFLDYVHLVTSSSVPYVVMTLWSGRDKDNPEDKNSASHIWADLPGQLAVKIMGEFGSVLYAEPGQQVGPGKFSAGTWQVRKYGKVWGAAIKCPPDIAAKIPTTVPQSWRALEALVLGSVQAPKPKPAA